MKILYCRTGWMENYKGFVNGDRPINGGKWNHEHIGHEIFNFLPHSRRYFGYVKPGKEKNGEEPKVGRIHIDKLGANANDESIDGVLVVWVAKDPKRKGQFIVGWYKNATVYKKLQKVSREAQVKRRERSDDKKETKDHIDYNITASRATLVPANERDFQIKGMGHSNIWYGESSTDADVIKYIENYKPGIKKKAEPTEWIIPCDPKAYRIDDAFRELGDIEWGATNGIKEGDFCYMYIGRTAKAIRYKCKAVSDIHELPKIDDSEYATGEVEGSDYRKWIVIRPIGYYPGDGITLEDLREHGLKGSMQSQRRALGDLKKFIHSKRFKDFGLKIEDDIKHEVERVASIPEPIVGKEREVLTKQRTNQGQFRRMMLGHFDGKCCICGLGIDDMLVASHIKPWSKSTDKQKVSKYNGLLLCAIHDKLFDEGYITFEDDGRLIVSKDLTKGDLDILKLDRRRKIQVEEENKPFLKYHREKVFRDAVKKKRKK